MEPMSTEFVALDVETADPSFASVCQIGIVTSVEGSVIESWQQIVNPEDYFADLHTLKHGIDVAKTRLGIK
jgi:DNA polymerase-3 subunit epsilon